MGPKWTNFKWLLFVLNEFKLLLNNKKIANLIKQTMKKIILPLSAAAVAIALGAGSALANCYTASGYVAPDQLRCTQVGTDYLGKPIWQCCD